MTDRRIAIVGPFKAWGGIEGKVVTLADGFLAAGFAVDLVLVRGGQIPYPERLSAGVNVVDLQVHSKLDGVPRLAAYLRRTRPAAVLTVKDHSAKIALLARLLALSGTPVFIKATNTLSKTLRRPLQRLMVRWMYPRADGVIAISEGVRKDLIQSFKVPAHKITVIYNPAITADFPQRSAQPVDHPWLMSSPGCPVILAAGRLTPQKGFDTLLEAFARLRRQQPARLIILGEGAQRDALEERIQALGIDTDVSLPGFVPDTLPFMARASLFVLSSRYEGLGNVLIEAMAAGCPALVSTECPSGPAEILDHGHYGTLVPVDDPEAMTTAMIQALQHSQPRPPKAVARFEAHKVCGQYLDTLGMNREPAGTQAPIALLFATSGHSGVDRVVKNLLPELGRHKGLRFDLITIRGHGPHVERLPDNVRRVALSVRHKNAVLPSLCLYLYRHRPQALLSANHPLNRAALLARRMTGVKTRVTIRMGMALSVQGSAGPGKPARVVRSMSRWYPLADAVITPSQGVARDLAQFTGVQADRLHVIPNPIVNGAMMQSSEQPVEHPWFADKNSPVILGVGELSERKDFATLLRAFARVHQQREARLVILGEGRCRASLERQADELGISDDLWLPGFDANPYRFMRRANLFVSASRREGSSAVIVEALAHGLPVVSTDCPSGPAESLAGGRYGHLVPIGDAEVMAQAMLELLDAPPDDAHQREGAIPFSAAASSAAYLHALGIRQT